MIVSRWLHAGFRTAVKKVEILVCSSNILLVKKFFVVLLDWWKTKPAGINPARGIHYESVSGVSWRTTSLPNSPGAFGRRPLGLL